jgi:WD40 repeat protein
VRRWLQRWLIALSAVVTVIVSILVNLATQGFSPLLIGAIVVTVVLAVLLEFASRDDGRVRRRRWFGGRLRAADSRVVPRPEKLNEVLDNLAPGRAGQVAITTGIYGAGGFGKTTLADMVASHPVIRRRFPGGCCPVTIGDGLVGAELAAKINDVIELLSGERPGFTDPQIAGHRLGQVLDARPPMLLILDDVWWPEQLSAFEIGGRTSVRLVTTRRPNLLAPDAPKVLVDQMNRAQAAELLTAGLPTMRSDVRAKLLRITGHWPLLLALVNSRLRLVVGRTDSDVNVAATRTWELLNRSGPAVLDVRSANDRSQAVRATVALSVTHLSDEGAARFEELGIFVEDVPVPVETIAMLWRATGGLTTAQTRELLGDLVELSLATADTGRDAISLHDVLRRYLRSSLGERLRTVNAAFVDAIAADLPVAPDGAPMWWRLDPTWTYLWRHLGTHLGDAGQAAARDDLMLDLRWVGAKLRLMGPALLAADLTPVRGPRARELTRVVRQSAHLLGPTDPPEALVGVLLSRLRDQPSWETAVDLYVASCPEPLLACRWPLPDSFAPELVRVFPGHDGRVERIAMSRDGSVIATVDGVGTVRTWTVATGAGRALYGTGQRVWAVALAGDGSWLVTADSDRRLRAWNVASGTLRQTWNGHDVPVYAAAVADDGSWLASAAADGTVAVWDAATGRRLSLYRDHTRAVVRLVIDPAGRFVVSAGEDGQARIWDRATGAGRVLDGHSGAVRALAVSPDGATVSTVDSSRTVRHWSRGDGTVWAYRSEQTVVLPIEVAADGSFLAGAAMPATVHIRDLPRQRVPAELGPPPVRPDGAAGDSAGAPVARAAPQASVARAVLTGHTGRVCTIEIAADGTMLATGSEDGTVRLWRVPAATARDLPSEEALPVRAVVADPLGRWLAVGGDQGTTRVWDVAARRLYGVCEAHTEEVCSLAVTADGAELVSVGADGSVTVWDTVHRRVRTTFDGQVDSVQAVAVAPDGAWIAGGGFDGIVRVWRPDGTVLTRLSTASDLVHALAVSADGARLATAGAGGQVRLWDVATWDCLAAYTDHTGDVYALAIDRSGRWLVSGGGDHAIVVRDLRTGALVHRLTGHEGGVRSVDISGSGDLLVSGGDDATVRVWQLDTGRRLTMMRVAAEVRDCVWLPDGARVAVAGISGVYLFSLHPGEPPDPRPDGDG